MTGEVCERTERRWVCIELLQDYCEAAQGRFVRVPQQTAKPIANPDDTSNCYRVARPGILWNGDADPELDREGGKQRRLKPKDRPTPRSQKAMNRPRQRETASSIGTASLEDK